jgi:signal transduction histidine kinase
MFLRIATIVAAMLVVLAASSKALASVPRPSVERPSIDAAGQLSMWVDEQGHAAIDDVLAQPDRFRPSESPTPNLGVTSHALWVRLELAPGDAPFVAEVPYAQFDDVTFVVVHADGSYRAVRTGDARPFSEREQPEPTFVFDVNEPATDIYVRIASTGNVAAPLRLWEPRAFHAHAVNERLAQGLLLGIVAAMAAYNLFLLFALREKVYAIYVGFLLAFEVFDLALSGVGYAYVWGGSPWIQAHAVASGMTIGTNLLVRLGFAVLDAAVYVPKLERAARVVDAILGAMALLSFVVPPRFIIAGLVVVGPVGGALVIAALVIRSRQGSEPARYMLAGNLALIVGMVVLALRSGGVLPSNAFTLHMKDVGVVLQVVLLSLALAARIRTLQQDVARSAAVALDASERSNRELAHLDKLKDDFLANTSHELRTPLNGILGLTETLVAGAPDVTTRRTADLILTSGRRLSTIVDDVLAFATLRSDAATIARDPVDLAAVLTQVRSMFAAQASEKKLTLDLVMTLDGRGCVGETAKLEQVLHHLVGNAIKFTEAGTVSLSATHEQGRIRVAVRDTGPGIDDAAKASLFSVFEQADGSAKRDTGGLGLGLPLAKRIVELLGGELVVESTPGHGSTFAFTVEACELPAVELRESVQAPVRSNAFAPVARSIAPPPSTASGRGAVASLASSASLPRKARCDNARCGRGACARGRRRAHQPRGADAPARQRRLRGREGFEWSRGPRAHQRRRLRHRAPRRDDAAHVRLRGVPHHAGGARAPRRAHRARHGKDPRARPRRRLRLRRQRLHPQAVHQRRARRARALARA